MEFAEFIKLFGVPGAAVGVIIWQNFRYGKSAEEREARMAASLEKREDQSYELQKQSYDLQKNSVEAQKSIAGALESLAESNKAIAVSLHGLSHTN